MAGIQWLESAGLYTLVVVIVGTLLVLLYDVWLAKTHREMITTYCRDHLWARWTLSAVTLVCFLFAAAGLWIHFFL